MQTIKIIPVLMTMVFFFFAKSGNAQNNSDKKEPVRLEIKTSAQCEMCKSRIEEAVMGLKGVKSANLNQADGILTLKYNPEKTDAQKIKQKISETGYDADEIKANPAAYSQLPNCCKKK